MLNEMIFRLSDSELHAPDPWRYILRRHISYFADESGLVGLLEHRGMKILSNDGRLITLAGDFGSAQLTEPFGSWEYVEPEFGDLVGKMANLNPARWITAREALDRAL